MQKKLSVRELKIALEGLPDGLEIEITSGETEDFKRILEYAKKLQTKNNEGDT